MRPLLSLLLLAVAAPLSAQMAEVPDWFLNPPSRAGWVSAVASGQSKIDALGFAVAELAKQRTTRMQQDTGVMKAISVQRVGSISVRSLDERFETTSADSARKVIERTFRSAVQLVSADSSARIQAFRGSTKVGDEEEIELTVSLTGELKLFLDALSGMGARITTKETATHYFLMIAVPERALRQ
jgi:hypothetical protein